MIARTGQKLPIWTPRHAIEEGVDVVRVSQNLPSFSRGRVPQPDGIVQPATGQKPAIRTPRHPKHEGAMASQQPGRGQAIQIPDGHQRIRACTGEPNASIDAPTGKQAPIGTPSQREHRAALAGERLGVGAVVSVPELDNGSISSAGERAPIGGKGQALDVVGDPGRPEQGV